LEKEGGEGFLGLKMEGKGQRKEKITAGILFGFSLFYLLSSLRMKIGTLKYPGPGFIPVLIGWLLLFCTTLYLIRLFRAELPEKKPTTLPAGEEKNYRAIFGILGSTLVYPFILDPLKFLISTTAATFFMLFLLRPHKPLFAFSLALGMAVASFLIFSRLLGVALPMGFLEEILFRIGG
jgi:hypothetical protein